MEQHKVIQRITERHAAPKSLCIDFSQESPLQHERHPTSEQMLNLIEKFSSVIVYGRYFWGLQATHEMLRSEQELSLPEYLYVSYIHLTCRKVIFGDSETAPQFEILHELYKRHESHIQAPWKQLLEFELLFSIFDTNQDAPSKKVTLHRVNTELEALQESQDTRLSAYIHLTKGKCLCAIAELFPSDWRRLFNQGLQQIEQSRNVYPRKASFYRVWVKIRLWKRLRQTDQVMEKHDLNLIKTVIRSRDAWVALTSTTLRRVYIPRRQNVEERLHHTIERIRTVIP